MTIEIEITAEDLEEINEIRSHLDRCAPYLLPLRRACGPFVVQEGSRFAEDNEVAAPAQPSHAVQYSLLATFDHVQMLRDLLGNPQVTLYTNSYFTLARSVIESACDALWLMIPDDPRIRLLRTLVVKHREMRTRRQLFKELPDDPSALADMEQAQEIQDLLAQKAIEVGFTQKEFAAASQTQISDVVKQVGESVIGDGSMTLVMWKGASAFAHGRQWASLVLGQTSYVDHDPSSRSVRVISSANLTVLNGAIKTAAVLAVRAYEAAIEASGDTSVYESFSKSS